MPSVILFAEATKLCLSIGFLSTEVGSVSGAWQVLVGGSVKSWIAFAIPSALYSINNNLDMLNNQYMDPATEQVLVQLKVLTTGIVWWLVFRQPLGIRKWISLVLLFVGALLAALPSNSTSKRTMYIEPFGFLLVFLYVWISASAGVYNEWLYKGVGKGDSIHTCNIRLYAIGCVFNFCAYLVNSPSDSPLTGILNGYNRYVWALVATYSLMGLLLAQVMKYFDNIVKLFISGASMYVQTFLSWAIFGYSPSASFLASLVFVSAAILMYNAEKFVREKGLHTE